jgi:hypothetical protein
LNKFLVFLFIYASINFAQSYSDSWKLFDDSKVAEIYIWADPVAVAWMFNNPHSDSMHLASMRFKNEFIDDSISSIAIRIRGNTSRDAEKKSLKVSFNTFVPGREFYGVDKLNLNGEHNDPSIIRSKLCFDLFEDAQMTASRSAHAAVYINGQYYGLYINIEHIDDEFLKKNFLNSSGNLWKCLYPADLKYLGDNPDLYKLLSGGRPVYELNTNETLNDYSALARFIKIINQTPINVLPDSLEKVIDVASVLKYFAMNVLVGGWDDYRFLKNNYYLYHQPDKDLIYLIPYDYDNTFGIDWFDIDWSRINPYTYANIDNSVRPLSTRMMSVPEYRNLLTRYLNFYREKVFLGHLWEGRIDSLKNRITNYVIADTFRTLDYGFTMTDFHNSFSGISYNKFHVKRGIKEFINIKNATLPGILSYVASKPLAYNIEHFPKSISFTDSIQVQLSAFSNVGISNIQLKFYNGVSGGTETYQMLYSPITNSKRVEDADRWIGVIPALGEGGYGSYEVIITDNNSGILTYPRSRRVNISVTGNNQSPIVINEFLAKNDGVYPDPHGENDDWIEFYNTSNDTIDMSLMYLTDKKDNLNKWRFPQGFKITPKGYLLVWCDEQSTQTGLHSNFKLSADGEFIGLSATDGLTILDSISFGPQSGNISFSRSPSGSTNWRFTPPTPLADNWVTSVEHSDIIPNGFGLTSYPNPFNPVTKIKFTLPSVVRDLSRNGEADNFTSRASLKVYDMLGNEIARLFNENKQPGVYEVEFDTRNYGLSSGIYFVVLRYGELIATQKILMLK